MGLLDQLAGSVLGSSGPAAGGANPNMIGAVMQLLSGGQQAGGGGMAGLLGGMLGGSGGGSLSSGIQALVAQFAAKGLGDVVQSWIGKGPNQEVSGAQLHEVLGDDKMNALAQGAGLSVGQFAPLLAQALPNIVNHLTPNGDAADADAMHQTQGGDLLKNLLGALG